MHKWYVIQVMSAQENKVQKALLEQLQHLGLSELIERVLIPTENVSEVKQGQQKVVERRIWPGYILVKMTMTDDTWQYVKKTPGVIDFLGGNSPTSLTDSEVEEILRDLEQKQRSVTQKHKFKPGDNVKIVDGVFVNFVGTVTEVSHEKGRLSVSVSIFGRETQVDDLEFSQVEEVSDDAIAKE